MLDIAMKAVVMYFVLLGLVRIMGKREISKLSPFDLVVAIMIAELAALPIEDKETTLIEGILPITILVIFEIILAYLSLKSNFIRLIVNGKPVVLIKDGKIMYNSLKETRYNINDLLLQLRKKDVFDISEIKMAILETSGDLTVVKKDDKKGVVLPVVIDSKVSKQNLKILNLKKEWLLNKLKKENIKLSEILLATINENKKLVYYKK